MANRIDLSNILINFLKKARYERHIEEGTLEENQFYAVTDGNEKTEYGDLFGNIENQADLYNALYASRLFKMEMCNDIRGYDIVHKLYDRREFDLSKFTVVGNPTITEDGVASGFSNKDYLTLLNDTALSNNNSFSIAGKFTTSDDLTTNQCIIGVESVFKIRIEGGQLNLLYKTTNKAWGVHSRYYPLKNTVYYYNFSFTGDSYDFCVGTDASNLNKIYSNQDTSKLVTKNTPILLGCAFTVENGFLGSIDLKAFSITVDGEEVFNGLKDLTQYDTYTLPSSEVITIPYIPSVDGVKIVDVAYKPLVDQLYTETGMGNYIIIDETNKTFRLPLPDIYSQIEKKTSFTLRKWED